MCSKTQPCIFVFKHHKKGITMTEHTQLADQLFSILTNDFAGKDYLPDEVTNDEALAALKSRLEAAPTYAAAVMCLREFLGSLPIPGLSLAPAGKNAEPFPSRGLNVRRKGDSLYVLHGSFDGTFREGDRISALGKETIPEIRERMNRFFAFAENEEDENWEIPLLIASNCLLKKPDSSGTRLLFKRFPASMIERNKENTGKRLEDPAKVNQESAISNAIFGNTERYPMKEFYQAVAGGAQGGKEEEGKDPSRDASTSPVPAEVLEYIRELAGPKHPTVASFPKGPAPFLIDIRQMDEDGGLMALLAENREDIMAAPYLVIDLRNAQDGFEETLFPLIPWLFDEAISPAELLPPVPYRYLYTKANSASLKKEYLSLLADCEEETMELVTELLADLKTREEAGFQSEQDDAPEEWTKKWNSVHYAGKAVILIDSLCRGAAERMADAFRRSPKVTVVGRPTCGACGWPALASQKLTKDLELFYPASITEDLAGTLKTLAEDSSVSAPRLLSAFRQRIKPDVYLPWDPSEAQDAASCLARYLLGKSGQ